MFCFETLNVLIPIELASIVYTINAHWPEIYGKVQVCPVAGDFLIYASHNFAIKRTILIQLEALALVAEDFVCDLLEKGREPDFLCGWCGQRYSDEENGTER